MQFCTCVGKPWQLEILFDLGNEEGHFFIPIQSLSLPIFNDIWLIVLFVP